MSIIQKEQIKTELYSILPEIQEMLLSHKITDVNSYIEFYKIKVEVLKFAYQIASEEVLKNV